MTRSFRRTFYLVSIYIANTAKFIPARWSKQFQLIFYLVGFFILIPRTVLKHSSTLRFYYLSVCLTCMIVYDNSSLSFWIRRRDMWQKLFRGNKFIICLAWIIIKTEKMLQPWEKKFSTCVAQMVKISKSIYIFRSILVLLPPLLDIINTIKLNNQQDN